MKISEDASKTSEGRKSKSLEMPLRLITTADNSEGPSVRYLAYPIPEPFYQSMDIHTRTRSHLELPDVLEVQGVDGSVAV